MGRLFHLERLIIYFSLLSTVLSHINFSLHRRNSANFNALNRTLGGTLSRGIPLAAPCYSNDTSTIPNSISCSTIQANYDDELFIAENFGGYENSNWGLCQANNRGCNLN